MQQRLSTYRQVKSFVLKGWPTQVTQKALQPFSRHKNELTVQNSCILYGINWSFLQSFNQSSYNFFMRHTQAK